MPLSRGEQQSLGSGPTPCLAALPASVVLRPTNRREPLPRRNSRGIGKFPTTRLGGRFGYVDDVKFFDLKRDTTQRSAQEGHRLLVV